MPIWFELIVMLLAAYAVGLALGWVFWGRDPAGAVENNEEDTEQ